MPVVGVAHMRVGMLQFLMEVLVGMPEGAIGGQTVEILRRMLVLMMGIATAWIVAVAMGVLQRLMPMQVAVLLTQQQRNTDGHQPRGQQQGR